MMRSARLFIAVLALWALPSVGSAQAPGGLVGSFGGPTITSGTTPIVGGADTQVCFNDAGALSCGNSGLTFGKALGALKLSSALSTYDSQVGSFQINLSSDTTKRLYFGYDSNLGANGSGYIQAVRSGVVFTPLLLNPNGGNVGIGATTPATALEILKTANGPGFILRDGDATHYNDLQIRNDTNSASRTLSLTYVGSSYAVYWVSGTSGEQGGIGTTGAYPLTFGTGNTQRMMIATGGNVGIGTISPGALLDVAGNINTSGVYLAADGSASAPSFSFSGHTNYGLYYNGGGLDFVTAGTSRLYISASGINTPGSIPFGFAPAAPDAAACDVCFNRDAANTLALRNGTNAQTLRVYGTTDGVPTNFDYLNITKAAGGAASIQTVKGGTGTASTLSFGVSGANNWTINTSGHFVAATDNTYDIGDGSHEPRDLYLGNAIKSPNILGLWGAYVGIYTAVGTAVAFWQPISNGVLSLVDASGSNWSRLTFGGITASYPAIKRSSATLAFRLADDSADAAITASTATFSAIASDATHTDATVCVDTTTGLLLKGSGAIGICLGTSSARYKQDIGSAHYTIADVLALEPKSYRYRKGWGDDGLRQQVGFLAEDVVNVLPGLVGLDKEGRPNSVDIVGMIPLLVAAIKEQNRRIESLEALVLVRKAMQQ